MKVFLALAVFTLLVRLPFFFPAVIDPDESTFILLGQDILDGSLPYVRLWDVKPPLLPFYFAVFISLFGKTIPAVRLGGAICVLLASFFVYLAGQRLANSRTGIIAALLLIIFSALSDSGGGTTSEIIAIVPLTGAALLFLKGELRTRDIFFAGFLISTACMVRLNLAYFALAGGALLLSGKLFHSPAGAPRRIIAYAAGGLIPAVLCFLPYLITEKADLFIASMFKAPLSYSSEQLTFLEAIYKHAARLINPSYLFRNALLWIGFVGGLIYIFLGWKGFAETTRTRLSMVIFFLLAAFLSIIKTGEAYEHYLVQAFPFLCLIAAFFFDYLLNAKGKNLLVAAVVLALIGPVSAIIGAYEPVAERSIAGQRLTYGPAVELAEFLEEVNPGNAPVYFMHGHIVHWFQDTKPSRFAAHPNNIGKEYLLKAVLGPSATAETELAGILHTEPAFIVKLPTVRYLQAHPDALTLLNETLFMDYELINIIDDLMVYRRTDFPVQVSAGR